MEESQREMQLLSPSSSSDPPAWSKTEASDDVPAPSLDLELSISVATPLKPPPSECVVPREAMDPGCIKALKWQAEEQLRLARIERAYAERLRELTRREMELAQAEFSRARSIWEMARSEVERAEQLKIKASQREVGPSGLEITCCSCRHK